MPQRSNKTANSSKMGYAPVAMSRAVVSQRIPQIASNGNTTRISHSEFFANVSSVGTAYSCSSFPCNPGVASIFPWLSAVAQRYETYKFRKLQFEFHTRAATSQVGTVGMVFDFDAEDAAPSSQMMALSYHDKCADSPWKDDCVVLDLVQGDRLPVRYTRAGTPVGTYDIKTYDVGNLHVFVDGVAASTNLGLLEVKYIIDLYTPQIQDPVGGGFYNNAGQDGTHVFGTGFGTNASQDPQAIAVGFTDTSGQVFTFNQAWQGLMAFIISGTALSANFAPVAANGDATVITQIANTGATSVQALVRVRAYPGTTITPTITATTVTSLSLELGSCAFDQLGS